MCNNCVWKAPCIPTASQLRTDHESRDTLARQLVQLLRAQLEMEQDPYYHSLPISQEMYDKVGPYLASKGYTFVTKPVCKTGALSLHICV
jgi:hypothetical protein